jgi:hypothetical protein
MTFNGLYRGTGSIGLPKLCWKDWKGPKFHDDDDDDDVYVYVKLMMVTERNVEIMSSQISDMGLSQRRL